MIDLYNKLNYLKISLFKKFYKKGFNCPNCGQTDAITISRKYLITSLVRCINCKLMYRTPTTTNEENNQFYQEDYNAGYTTDCPDDQKLNELIKANFINFERSYEKYFNILKTISNKTNLKLLDFGCSWGYGSFQLKELGYDVHSYEISLPRRKYAKDKLNLNIIDNIENLNNNEFDIFFSAHVLEHLPNLNTTLDKAFKVMKKDGFFVGITPNGSKMHKNKNKNWNKLWGMVHPNFLDEEFYKVFFKDYKYYISSSPFNTDTVSAFIKNEINYCENLDGEELLIIVKNK